MVTLMDGGMGRVQLGRAVVGSGIALHCFLPAG